MRAGETWELSAQRCSRPRAERKTPREPTGRAGARTENTGPICSEEARKQNDSMGLIRPDLEPPRSRACVCSDVPPFRVPVSSLPKN